MSADVQEAKRRLPLPGLMQELGCGDRAKKSARCPFPFHDDKHASFSIFEKDGQHFWKCHSRCGSGDAIDFLATMKGIDVKEATKEFLRMAGISGDTRAPKPATTTEVKPAMPLAPPLVKFRRHENVRGRLPCARFRLLVNVTGVHTRRGCVCRLFRTTGHQTLRWRSTTMLRLARLYAQKNNARG